MESSALSSLNLNNSKPLNVSQKPMMYPYLGSYARPWNSCSPANNPNHPRRVRRTNRLLPCHTHPKPIQFIPYPATSTASRKERKPLAVHSFQKEPATGRGGTRFPLFSAFFPSLRWFCVKNESFVPENRVTNCCFFCLFG